jgi:hypothetical protein
VQRVSQRISHRPRVAGHRAGVDRRADRDAALARRVADLEAENRRLRITVAVATHAHPNPDLLGAAARSARWPVGVSVGDVLQERFDRRRRIDRRRRRVLGGHL